MIHTKYVGKALLTSCLLTVLLSCSIFSQYSSRPGVTYVASKGNPEAYRLVWSPKNAEQLLISSRSLATGNGQVEILDLQTKQETLIAQTKYADLLGSGWSPDGKSIVLSVGDKIMQYPKAGLWLFNTADNTRRLLNGRTGTAVWLANSTQLALFTVDLASDAHPRRLAIYLIDTQSASEKLIYSNGNAVAFWGATASPDGSRLVFSLHTGNATASDIFILNLNDGKTLQLTRNSHSTMPAWSPSTNIIAYEVDYYQLGQTGSRLHLATPDANCDTEVLQLGNVSSPTWSPNGKELAFIASDGIYVANLVTLLGRDINQNLCSSS